MPRRDQDDDDDRPRKRSNRAPDDKDRPSSHRRRVVDDDDDDDDDDRPSARSRRADEDNYDDEPRKPKKKKRPVKKEMSVVGIVALVIGAVSVLLSFIPCFASISLIPAGIGIVVGFIGLVLAQRSEGRQGLGMPIAGISVSAVAVLIAVGWLVLGKQIEKKFDREFKDEMAEIAKEGEARQKEQAKAAGEVKAAQPGTVIRVSAVQFFKAYENDDERADRLYKNKVLEVTGTFHEVNFAAGDVYVVELRAGGEEFETVSCIFAKDPETRAMLARLMPGQQITIRGKCLGDEPTIEACIMVN